MKTERFPRRVYGQGAEPDPRFSLANERTFLAWLRTSLALIAAGVALEALTFPASAHFRLAAAGIFVGLGILAAVCAWTGWMATERALRNGSPLRGLPLGPLFVGCLIVAVALVVTGGLV